jgi:hypothetical protein
MSSCLALLHSSHPGLRSGLPGTGCHLCQVARQLLEHELIFLLQHPARLA